MATRKRHLRSTREKSDAANRKVAALLFSESPGSLLLDFALVLQVGSREVVMAGAVYKIVAYKGAWGVLHEGTVSGDYITKEAAFEAAVGPASNAIKNGQAVTIIVEGSVSGEPALGKR
jgi:hypothetical protein